MTKQSNIVRVIGSRSHSNNTFTNWINEINSSIMPSITGNLIFTVSNEGYLYVLEKNNGSLSDISIRNKISELEK